MFTFHSEVIQLIFWIIVMVFGISLVLYARRLRKKGEE
jgi:hypothetical protein